MQYDEVRLSLIHVLSLPQNAGIFLTAKQICQYIQQNQPRVWKELTSSFPAPEPNTWFVPISNKYTPESFIENALKYYSTNNGIPGLETTELNITNINDSENKKSTFAYRLS